MAGFVPPGVGSLAEYEAQGVAASIAADLGVTGLTDFVPGVNLLTLPYTIYNIVQFVNAFFAGVPREAKTLGPADLLEKDTDIRCVLLADYIVRQYKGKDQVLSSVRSATYNPARFINFLIWCTQTDLHSRYWNGAKGYLDIPPPPNAVYNRHVILGYVGSYYAVKASFDNYIPTPGAPPTGGMPTWGDLFQIGGYVNHATPNIVVTAGQWVLIKCAISSGTYGQSFLDELGSQRGVVTAELMTAYARGQGGWENVSVANAKAILTKIADIPTSGLIAELQQEYYNQAQSGNAHPTPNAHPHICDQQINSDFSYIDGSQPTPVPTPTPSTQPGTTPKTPPPVINPQGGDTQNPLTNFLKEIVDDIEKIITNIEHTLRPGQTTQQQQQQQQNNQNKQQQQQDNVFGGSGGIGAIADAQSNPTIIVEY